MCQCTVTAACHDSDYTQCTHVRVVFQLPAYEFNFSDVNPPVHAWACLHVYESTVPRDIEFIRRCFHHLVPNFTWYYKL